MTPKLKLDKRIEIGISKNIKLDQNEEWREFTSPKLFKFKTSKQNESKQNIEQPIIQQIINSIFNIYESMVNQVTWTTERISDWIGTVRRRIINLIWKLLLNVSRNSVLQVFEWVDWQYYNWNRNHLSNLNDNDLTLELARRIFERWFNVTFTAVITFLTTITFKQFVAQQFLFLLQRMFLVRLPLFIRNSHSMRYQFINYYIEFHNNRFHWLVNRTYGQGIGSRTNRYFNTNCIVLQINSLWTGLHRFRR